MACFGCQAARNAAGVTQPKYFIKSSLAPWAPGPPWIGKVQCNRVHAKHSGPIRARVVGSREPTRQQNCQTKPISCNPKGINGFRLASSTAGRRIRKIRRVGPVGYKSRLVARTWRCSSVRVRGRLPSNKIAKQSQFLIKPIFTVIYIGLGGLIASSSTSAAERCGLASRNPGPPIRATGNSSNRCFAGIAVTGGTCPGEGPAIPTASGSRKSCCSRRAWLPSSPTTNAS